MLSDLNHAVPLAFGKELNGLDHLAFNYFVDQCFDFNFENDCPLMIFNMNALNRQVYRLFLTCSPTQKLLF